MGLSVMRSVIFFILFYYRTELVSATPGGVSWSHIRQQQSQGALEDSATNNDSPHGRFWSEIRDKKETAPKVYAMQKNKTEGIQHMSEREEGLSNFRKEKEKEHKQDMIIPLRSSDIEHEDHRFRGSDIRPEHTSALSPPKQDKAAEELESLRATEEELMPTEEDSLLPQAFRTVEKQQNEKDFGEKEKLVASSLDSTFKDMKQHGINVNLMNTRQEKLNGCKENEIYFMDKEKMFLISSEKIGHDISGLAQFEANLWSQIKNQDEIIKTLKARLKSAEKQEKSIKYIVDTMKSSENARKKELQETKDLLKYSRAQIKHLENITEHQTLEMLNTEKKVEKLKLTLHKKDTKIKDLKNRLKQGEQTEKVKYLEGEIELCQKEKISERETRKVLEGNLENLKTASMVLQQSGGQTQEDFQLMKKEVDDQNNLIGLLKKELVNHKKDIQELNNIVLQKDVVVQGLQDQVASFLSHDYHVLQGCDEKDKQIEMQYQALASVKNMTYMQDTLTRAKDKALKILQKTVYEMVEKISQCSDEAVKGLQEEIAALKDMQKPLKSEVGELKKALQATKNVLAYKNTEEKHTAYKKLLSSHARSLQLCHEETKTQHRELRRKIERDNRDLQIEGVGCTRDNCQEYCRDIRILYPQNQDNLQSYPNTTARKEAIRNQVT